MTYTPNDVIRQD